jgi:hypothetical protein
MFSLAPEMTDKITYILWADASQSGEWKFANELEYLQDSMPLIESVGFNIYEDDEKIVLSACFCNETDDIPAQSGRRATIPKTNIRMRRELDLGVYKN